MNINLVRQNEPVYVSLDVVWQGAAGKFNARIGEISMVGCFIESMGQEILGETVSINAKLPSGIWVTLHGEVIYSEYPVGFEVRFINVTNDNQKLLIQVVAAHGGKQAQLMLEQDEKLFAAPKTNQLRRVLVADDDPMIVEMVRASVEIQDFDAVCVTDGRDAFRILQEDANFSAAIFDMMMPHLDGLGLVLYMKNEVRLRHIPIGMITAEQDPKIWDDSVSAGISVFLPKPFSPPQIQMMLRMLVSKSDSAEQLPPVKSAEMVTQTL